MNSEYIKHITKTIWIGGIIVFLYYSLPNLWGTIKFLFNSTNGHGVETEPWEESKFQAAQVLNSVISTLFICLILQLIVFAFPFLVTKSGSLVQYYADREKHYIKALSGRLDLAHKLTNADNQLTETAQAINALKDEVFSCRQQIQYLSEECAELTNTVVLSRQSLTEQISQQSKLNTKGDF